MSRDARCSTPFAFASAHTVDVADMTMTLLNTGSLEPNPLLECSRVGAAAMHVCYCRCGDVSCHPQLQCLA